MVKLTKMVNNFRGIVEKQKFFRHFCPAYTLVKMSHEGKLQKEQFQVRRINEIVQVNALSCFILMLELPN